MRQLLLLLLPLPSLGWWWRLRCRPGQLLPAACSACAREGIPVHDQALPVKPAGQRHEQAAHLCAPGVLRVCRCERQLAGDEVVLRGAAHVTRAALLRMLLRACVLAAALLVARSRGRQLAWLTLSAASCRCTSSCSNCSATYDSILLLCSRSASLFCSPSYFHSILCLRRREHWPLNACRV